MKKIFLGLIILLSTNAFAEEVFSLNCRDQNGNAMVEATIDLETGDGNHFVHFARRKPEPSILSHIETDPAALAEGTEMEIFTVIPNGEPVAKLTIFTLKESKEGLTGAGTLEYNLSGEAKVIPNLVCVLTNHG